MGMTQNMDLEVDNADVEDLALDFDEKLATMDLKVHHFNQWHVHVHAHH